MLFRINLTTPEIARRLQIINPGDAAVYGLVTGYGTRNGPWVSMPTTIVQGLYACGDEKVLFSAIPGSDSPWLKNFTFSLAGGQIGIDVDWTDATAGAVGVHAQLKAVKAAVYEGPGGCMPCVGGLGSLYWSYTNMQDVATLGGAGGKQLSGVGWFDHEWLASGRLDGVLLRLLVNLENFIATPFPLRWIWIWLTLQLRNGTEYMISSTLKALPSAGKSYPLEVVKIDQDGKPTYGLKGSALVQTMTQVGAQSFPTQYALSIEGVTYTLKACFGNGIVHLPQGAANWDAPGDVLDASGAVIGVGFMEANQLLEEDGINAVPAATLGIPVEIFRERKTPVCTALISLMLILLLVALVVFLLVQLGTRLYRVFKADE